MNYARRHEEDMFDYRRRLRETIAYPPNFQVCDNHVNLQDRKDPNNPPIDSDDQLNTNAWHRMMCKARDKGKFDHLLPVAVPSRRPAFAHHDAFFNDHDPTVVEATAVYVPIVDPKNNSVKTNAMFSKNGTGKRRKRKFRNTRRLNKKQYKKNKK